MIMANPNAAPVLFDRALLQARHNPALRSKPATVLLDRVAEDAMERLQAVLRQFKSAADIGTAGNQLRKKLGGRVDQRSGVDLPDIESEPIALEPESLDLAVSALALQFVDDLPGVLAQIRRALRPDGLLLAAMIGGDTLTELRQSFAAAEVECEGGVSPRVAPFADLRDIGALLQRAGFALPVTDVDRVTVRYDSALALMMDLRRMGATNILLERRRAPTRRAALLRMSRTISGRGSSFETAPNRRLLMDEGASRFTSTHRSDAGSGECPPAASGSRAICWRGPRRASAARARPPRRPSAGRCKAA